MRPVTLLTETARAEPEVKQRLTCISPPPNTLKGIQWVPGAGQPNITHWPEVYRKIAKAGKLIQFSSGQSSRGIEALDVLADQLGSARNLIMIAGADRRNEDQTVKLLDRYGAMN